MPKPSYKTNDPKGWCGDPKRGAALGRSDRHTDAAFDGKLTLRKVRLDSGGYDSNGTYFGDRLPGWTLYWYASHDDEGRIDAMLDATSRLDAKAKIRKRYPKARFHK